MSATDILKKLGKPTQSTQLLEKIAEELGISARQAYRKIKEAWKDKEIRKYTLPDGSVVYAFPEWASQLGLNVNESKETLNFNEAFVYQCFKQLKEISDQAVYGEIGFGKPCKALREMLFFIARLPRDLKDKIKPLREEVLNEVVQKQKQCLEADSSGSSEELEYESACRHALRELMSEVSTLLHDYKG